MTTPFLRFRLYIAGIIKDESIVNVFESTPEDAEAIQARHTEQIVAAEANGQKWLIEVHDPDQPEQSGYMRFGTDDAAMCDPIPLDKAPRHLRSAFNLTHLRQPQNFRLEHNHGPRNIDDAFANLPADDDLRRINNIELPESFTCPQCKRTSYNRADLANGWCGNCHAYTAPPGNTEAAR